VLFDLGTEDGRGAPQQADPIDGDFDRAEGEDGRRRMMLGELARGLPRLGKQRNAAQVKVVGGVAVASQMVSAMERRACLWRGSFW